MWIIREIRAWCRSHRSLRQRAARIEARIADEITQSRAEAARREALIARLVAENQELRAIVVQLDFAVTDLSIQLWGKQAYDRAVDQHRRNGNN